MCETTYGHFDGAVNGFQLLAKAFGQSPDSVLRCTIKVERRKVRDVVGCEAAKNKAIKSEEWLLLDKNTCTVNLNHFSTE